MTNPVRSRMMCEIDEAAAAVDRLLANSQATIHELAALMRRRGVRFVSTAGRGSSDNAATYFKYLFEICAGLPVASLGPSIASIYKAPLSLDAVVHLTVSQSGASPDIVELQAAARRGGALTAAFVNVADSPLAEGADVVVPLHSGEELSVAATKTFIASGVALAALVAAYCEDRTLSSALVRLPRILAEPPPALDVGLRLLSGVPSFYTTARGPALGIALEAALKAKETAVMHAEAVSVAELMHGPVRLATEGFPVLAFMSPDAARRNTAASLDRLRDRGIAVLQLEAGGSGVGIHIPSSGHGLIDPLALISVYYRLIERVSVARGLDPDAPPGLAKITRTI